MHIVIRAFLAIAAAWLLPSSGTAHHAAAPVQSRSADHPEMSRMYEADQAIRKRLSAEGFTQKIVMEMIEGDMKRYARTKELVDAGALKTGNDFNHAAYIFQHGSKPADYLLAHTLAVASVARGRADAAWIAAATLDRYLQAIGQKQIYGTQFSAEAGEPATQEPYDRALISDALRGVLGVPTQAEQEKRRQGMKMGSPPKKIIVKIPASKPR